MIRTLRAIVWAASACLWVGLVGCDSRKPAGPDLAALLANPDSVEFLDDVVSNQTSSDDVIGALEFIDTLGNQVRLKDFIGDQNVLLVFTRGFSGQLCPFCTTQTSRLIANYDEFKQRNTEVLLVYPGQKAQLPDFLAASMKSSASEGFPFPVLLDEDLTAVKQLNIAAQLAHPSAFIIDKNGSVKLSYVGKNPIDRPSIKALLDQLDRLEPQASP